VAGAVQGSPVEADDGAEGRATSWIVGGKREKAGICMSETGRGRGQENEEAESWFLATDSRKSL